MNNKQKYDKAFVETFEIDKTQIGKELVYQSVPLWDSVGHMGLIAALEDEFDIQFSDDQIVKMLNVGLILEAIKEAKAL